MAHRFRLGLSWVGAVLLTGLLAGMGIATPAQGAEPDTATSQMTVPYELSISGANGAADALFTLPVGAEPVRLEGTIKANYNYPGQVFISVAGKRAAAVDARKGGPLAVDLNPSDVTEGSIPVGMRVSLDGPECFPDDDSSATIEQAKIIFRHPTTPPSTIAGFLSPGIDSYQVVVSPSPTPAEQQAALNAVLALSSRFGKPTTVTLSATDAPPAADFQHRVVRITEGNAPGGQASAQLTGPSELTITGSAAALSGAAIALGDANTALIQGAVASGLTGATSFEPRLGPTPLADFGTQEVSLSGVGRHEAKISIPQPAFGSAVEEVRVDLKVTASAVPAGASGRVDVTWNSVLKESFTMGSGTAQTVSLTLTPADLIRDNTLGVTMLFTPEASDCSGGRLGGRVNVDMKTSTATAETGPGDLVGFDLLPQSFEPSIVVSLASSNNVGVHLTQAGYLLAALQQASPLRFTAELVPADVFKSQDRSGILVGATGSILRELDAPMRGGSEGGLEIDDPYFYLSVDTPIAVLQSFTRDDRQVLALGSASPSGEAEDAGQNLASSLAREVAANPNGWRVLAGQVVTMGVDQKLTPVAVAREDRPYDSVPWAYGIIILGVPLVLLLAWLWMRPRRRPDVPALPDPGGPAGSGNSDPACPPDRGQTGKPGQ